LVINRISLKSHKTIFLYERYNILMLFTNIHIFIHVRLNFFHRVKSHGVYYYKEQNE
jgi:hypothetical protein